MPRLPGIPSTQSAGILAQGAEIRERAKQRAADRRRATQELVLGILGLTTQLGGRVGGELFENVRAAKELAERKRQFEAEQPLAERRVKVEEKRAEQDRPTSQAEEISKAIMRNLAEAKAKELTPTHGTVAEKFEAAREFGRGVEGPATLRIRSTGRLEERLRALEPSLKLPELSPQALAAAGIETDPEFLRLALEALQVQQSAAERQALLEGIRGARGGPLPEAPVEPSEPGAMSEAERRAIEALVGPRFTPLRQAPAEIERARLERQAIRRLLAQLQAPAVGPAQPSLTREELEILERILPRRFGP